MARIRFLAPRDTLILHIESAESYELVGAIRELEKEREYFEEHPESRGGDWEERKGKYKEFYKIFEEVAKERFSEEGYKEILRLGLWGSS